MADELWHQCSCDFADELRANGTVSFDIVKARLAGFTTCDDDCSVDEFRPSVFETLRQFLIDHPCHACNKKSINLIFDLTSRYKPDLLCIDFVAQTVINVYVNENTLDWELVRAIIGIIKHFLQMESDDVRRDNLIFDVMLPPMARMLLTRFLASGEAEWHQDLAADVLDLFSIAYGGCNSDVWLKDQLVESFAFHPRRVFSIVCLAMRSMSNKEQYYKFWEDFATGVHEVHRSKWQSDGEFARKYATFLVHFEEAIRGKILNRCSCRFTSQWHWNATALVEVLRHQIDIIPNRQMLAFLVQFGRPTPVNLNRMFCEKLSWILTNENVTMHHEAAEFGTEDTKRFVDELNVEIGMSVNSSLLLNEFVEHLLESFLHMSVVYDLDLVEILIKMANYERVNNKRLYKKLLVDMMNCNMIYLKNDRALLESGIPQTLCRVINNLHENCFLCKEPLLLMKKLRKSISPRRRSIARELRLTQSVKLATALPYVLLQKSTLIKAMWPTGFDLLTKQLEQGEDIDTLLKLAEVCRSPPVASHWKTVSCTSEQPIRTEDEGAKVVVLDDGTKIPARTSHLVKNSDFFARLFDGTFAEASLDEIRLHDVTTFQFHFLEQFIAASWTDKINFDMDGQEHLDLIILCDKLLLPTLRTNLEESLRWHHLDAELLPEMYNVGFSFDKPELRKMCLDYVLDGDANHEPKPETVRSLMENVDLRNLFFEDLQEWIYEHAKNYVFFSKNEVKQTCKSIPIDITDRRSDRFS